MWPKVGSSCAAAASRGAAGEVSTSIGSIASAWQPAAADSGAIITAAAAPGETKLASNFCQVFLPGSTPAFLLASFVHAFYAKTILGGAVAKIDPPHSLYQLPFRFTEPGGGRIVDFYYIH
jgi:hypothetical protein